ncbi:hypothetical protein OUZ56_004028 [Daphnia magna]|uniref:Uncharacterized protein n=1 Tax=Daphnia magna TaxID=35525 RepID=A0ABQ9YNJ0_9CRUS|nr:hypothetical protein OUZ56_004028 [Daphnia magna]
MIICEIKQVKQVPSSTTPMKSRLLVSIIGHLFRIYALLDLLWSLSSIRKWAFICILYHQAVTNMFYTDKHLRQRAS